MREITVGVVAPAYVNVPLWIAQERGFLECRGLAATERICGTTHGVTGALRDGEVDIALTAPEGSIADAMAGGPLRVVAGLTDRPPLSMIALPRHHAFGDLRGGRIGTSSLTEGTRHVAERMLAAHGLTYPADYDFALEGSHVERWKALQAGTIDAALQMIPYDFMAVEAGFTDLGPVTEEFALNAVCVRLPAERAELTPFLRALAEAAQWFRGHVEESAPSRRNAPRSSRATRCVPARRWPPNGVIPRELRSSPGALAAVTAALRSSGLIPSEAPPRSPPPSTTPTCDGRLRRAAVRCGGRRRRPGRHVARGRTAPRGSAPGRAGTARGAAAVLQGAHDLPAHRGAVRDARAGGPLAGRGHSGAVRRPRTSRC